MKLGAQLFSLRNFLKNPDGLRETMQKLKDMGYECVQLSGNAPMDANEIAKIVKDLDMPIVNTHSPLDRIINDTENLINEHKKFGCYEIGLGYLTPEQRETKAGLDKLLVSLEEPVRKIEAAGLHFAYHNHDFEFAKLPDSDKIIYDILLEKCPNWKFIVDTYWMEFAGVDVIDYLNRIGAERLENVHFKDMGTDEKRSICACGDGTLDFAKIYETCKDLGVKTVLVEQDNAVDFADPFGEMEKSFKHLRPIIK